MKLRNKQTGEIKEWDFGNWYQTILNPGNKEKYECNLNDFINRAVKFREEWEDYEKPKEHWCITMYGGITRIKDDEEPIDDLIEIGNYFNSKEDAYDAWDKLKAWKRLRDKGFEIEGWNNNIGDDYYKTGQIVLNLNNVRNREWNEYDQIMEIKNDLDLLFSRGEE